MSWMSRGQKHSQTCNWCFKCCVNIQNSIVTVLWGREIQITFSLVSLQWQLKPRVKSLHYQMARRLTVRGCVFVFVRVCGIMCGLQSSSDCSEAARRDRGQKEENEGINRMEDKRGWRGIVLDFEHRSVWVWLIGLFLPVFVSPVLIKGTPWREGTLHTLTDMTAEQRKAVSYRNVNITELTKEYAKTFSLPN